MEPYRVSQVAAMFGVHPDTVRKRVKPNILRPVRLPGSDYNRFTSQEVSRLRREMGPPSVEEPEKGQTRSNPRTSEGRQCCPVQQAFPCLNLPRT